jgi:hypothetical protein
MPLIPLQHSHPVLAGVPANIGATGISSNHTFRRSSGFDIRAADSRHLAGECQIRSTVLLCRMRRSGVNERRGLRGELSTTRRELPRRGIEVERARCGCLPCVAARATYPAIIYVLHRTDRWLRTLRVKCDSMGERVVNRVGRNALRAGGGAMRIPPLKAGTSVPPQ